MINLRILVETGTDRFNNRLPIRFLTEETIHAILDTVSSWDGSNEILETLLQPASCNTVSILLIPEENWRNPMQLDYPYLIVIEQFKNDFRGIGYELEYLDLPAFVEMFLFAHYCAYGFFRISHFEDQHKLLIWESTINEFQQRLVGYMELYHEPLSAELKQYTAQLIDHYPAEFSEFVKSMINKKKE